MRWRWIWKADMRFLAVLTVKNEAAFLLEWLARLVWRDGCGRRLEPRFKTTQIFSPFGRDNT